jgi:N-acetylglucosaminyl-diphospho-decaprenol L-rhamnosyltransferase
MIVNSSNVGARFSVVIVNYNGGELVLECVHSAVQEGVPPFQIIIVDNGSADDSIQSVETNVPGVQVIRNNCNAGFARAVNQGIRQASSELILLLNNDARLESGALRAFADGFDALPKLAIAGGQLRYPDGRLQSTFAPLPTVAEEFLPLVLLKLLFPDRFRRKTLDEHPISVESVLGACLCVRSSIVPALGLLDEDYFFFFEEIDWCRRVHQISARVYYLPNARAIHQGGHTANRFRGPARVEYQRSKLTYFRKSRRLAVFYFVSGFLVLRTLINALFGTLMCAVTICMNKRLRLKAATYWYLFCWHALFRPASWGLPGKCSGQE